MKRRPLLVILAFALCAGGGFWLARTLSPRAERAGAADEAPYRLARIRPEDDPMPKFRRGVRDVVKKGDPDAENAGAIEGQRVLVFKDRAALNAYLRRLGPGVRVLGRLDALNALKVSFGDLDDLLASMDGSEEQAFVFPVSIPPLKDGSVQDGALAMGANLLKWLGITTDNSSWGKGVRIAILDTGVTASSSFSTAIHMINLVDLPGDPSKQNGHGTAVASMIIGSDSLTPGVAPSADILSIRIAGDDGMSDTFMLAKGIIAAADAGAGLINISMGSFGDSVIVKSALEYAASKGSLVFAATGNNGLDSISYPAAYQNVIAVGAVDAMGNHLDFSNTGSSIDMAAPGYAINAAWSGDQAASVTGTSFSTPIVVGAVAALMSERNLTSYQAWQLLGSYQNDGGTAGPDEQLGAGTPDLGRAMTGDTPGIYDAAVASSRILPPDAGNPYGQVEILVQNRGTETLVNTGVRINTSGGVVNSNITTLAPNAVTTVRVPIGRTAASGSTMTVDSSVVLSGGRTDAKPSNDRRVESYAPVSNP